MTAYVWSIGIASARELVHDRRGATIVEYAILLVLVLITAAAVFRVLGKDVRKSGDMATAQFT